MVSPLALWVMLGAGASVLLVAIALVGRAGDRAIARRVALIALTPIRRPRVAEPVPAGQVPLVDWLRRPFTFYMRRSWGVSASPQYLLLAGLMTAVGVWLLGTLVLRLPGYVIVIGAIVGFFLVPYLIVASEQRRSDAQFAELLPDAIDIVVRVVRAGLPVSAAIRTVGREAQPPLSTVFTKIADQTEIGIALAQALARTSAEVGNPDFHFLAVAVALQQTTGGNLAATLETLSQIIRKRRATRLKAMAATAEVRISAIILGALPFFVTAALLFAAPTYLDPLFADPRGHIILGLALLGLLLAGLTMRWMIRNMLAAG